MNTVTWRDLDAAARRDLLQRPTRADDARVRADVARLIEAVRTGGDAELRRLTQRFDGVSLDRFEVDDAEREQAQRTLDPALRQAMTQARARLVAWHRAGMALEFEIETAPGVRCGRVLRGIGRVGLYVPAGSAPLPSTALMLGVPAALAGCGEVVLCTPPQTDGRADPAVLAAAALCGITRVFKLGGAQAIAAMTFGTGSVPACDKLFGPGNAYVTAAKQAVANLPGGPAIDLPAGPSEVLVVADARADAVAIAADLLAQAEHGEDSQVLLVTDSPALAERVAVQLDEQLATLPRRAIAAAALANARTILVDDIAEAIAVSNAYAPEHLLLAVAQPRRWLADVRCAGSVFLGDHTPESLGDYCSGTNHVLPTDGAARACSGVAVASFQTSISVQCATRAGLAEIGPCAVVMARAEGLEAHAQAVLRRGVPA